MVTIGRNRTSDALRASMNYYASQAIREEAIRMNLNGRDTEKYVAKQLKELEDLTKRE